MFFCARASNAVSSLGNSRGSFVLGGVLCGVFAAAVGLTGAHRLAEKTRAAEQASVEQVGRPSGPNRASPQRRRSGPGMLKKQGPTVEEFDDGSVLVSV